MKVYMYYNWSSWIVAKKGEIIYVDTHVYIPGFQEVMRLLNKGSTIYKSAN